MTSHTNCMCSCTCSRTPSSSRICLIRGSSGSCSRCRCPPARTSTTCPPASGCHGDSFRWVAGRSRPPSVPCTCPSSGSRWFVLRRKIERFECWMFHARMNAASQVFRSKMQKMTSRQNDVAAFMTSSKFAAITKWVKGNLLRNF